MTARNGNSVRYALNILTLSVVYQPVAIPVKWQVVNQKGTAGALEHIAHYQAVYRSHLAGERIEKILGDREFGSRQLIEFLLEEEIDFLIRLKENHLASGISFKKRWRNVSERIKLRGKTKVEVFGLEVYVSCVKLKKGKKNRVFNRRFAHPKQPGIGRIQVSVAN